VTPRPGPGDLTIVAVALLAISGYALAAGSHAPTSGLVLVAVVCLSLLVVGIAGPVVALHGVEVSARTTSDALVGDRTVVQCRLHGRCRRVEIRVLDPPGPFQRAVAPGDAEIEHVAARRGVFGAVRVELRTATPLGVFMRRRLRVVPLPAPIHVGPRPVAVPAPPRAHELEGDGLPTRPAWHEGTQFRSVREYQAGDSMRLVHWPTTARARRMAVRETDPPVEATVAIRAELDGAGAEETAARAAGLALAALADGHRVLLLTCERRGPVAGEVRGARDVSRRLARAVSGPTPPVPAGWRREVLA
jgi:uncharacterized protein (DUF58 family)